MDILKAIIPAGGLGTRFLPYTKAIPKEMLPLLNKPAIQYIVEEGMASDIRNFIMVTSRDKYSISKHFDSNIEIETLLNARGKQALLASLERIIKTASFSYIRQPEPRGLGHAIWSARHAVCKEYFGIFLPDEIIISKNPGLGQLIKIARQERASVIGIQEVPIENVSSYGIIGVKKQITPNLFQIGHLVEKPDQKDAPSNLAIIGRYVLSHKIFHALEEIEADEREELQLTDAIGQMIRNNEKVFAYKIQGVRYDIGNPIGWIKAIIGCALQDPNYAPHINKFLEDKEVLEQFIYNPVKITENIL
jgi:UTP--glucose-1-phosphate uridylyltransferase